MESLQQRELPIFEELNGEPSMGNVPLTVIIIGLTGRFHAMEGRLEPVVAP